MRKIYRLIFLHFDGANVEYNIPKVALREREILWEKKKRTTGYHLFQEKL